MSGEVLLVGLANLPVLPTSILPSAFIKLKPTLKETVRQAIGGPGYGLVPLMCRNVGPVHKSCMAIRTFRRLHFSRLG